jgi:hypothetical protein
LKHPLILAATVWCGKWDFGRALSLREASQAIQNFIFALP